MKDRFETCKRRITTLSAFLAFVEEQKEIEERNGNGADFLFRGQPTDKPLIPKLGRMRWHDGLDGGEKLIRDEFDRMSPPFTKPGYDDKWDRIAIAQHHGLPTRLLDWTYNATAALWFAVKERPQKKDGKLRDGVVWVFKTVVEDFIEFPTKESPYAVKRTRVFRPRIIANRISAQSGVFTVGVRTKIHGKFAFRSLQEHGRIAPRLIRIPILAEHFEGRCKQLNACGVNYSTMFPDLDGLCRHIQWRYAKRTFLR